MQRANKWWRETEDTYLKKNYKRITVADLAKQLGRSKRATRTRLEKLGCSMANLKRNIERFWLPEELDIVAKNLNKPIDGIKELLPGKSWIGIYHKARELGRKKKEHFGYHFDVHSRKQISVHSVSVAEHRIIFEQKLGRKLYRAEQVS